MLYTNYYCQKIAIGTPTAYKINTLSNRCQILRMSEKPWLSVMTQMFCNDL